MSEKKHFDMTPFEASLLRSAEQAARGEYGRVHTPEIILARRAARASGSPANTQVEPDAVQIDREVIDAFKATGRDWQARINDALRDWLRTHQPG